MSQGQLSNDLKSATVEANIPGVNIAVIDLSPVSTAGLGSGPTVLQVQQSTTLGSVVNTAGRNCLKCAC